MTSQRSKSYAPPGRASPVMPESERVLAARIAAHSSWANTENRSARTAPARAALDAKFLAEAGGDPVRAEHLRKAYFGRLALKSAQARRKAKEVRTATSATQAEPEAVAADWIASPHDAGTKR